MDPTIRTYSREHVKKFKASSPPSDDCFIINHVRSPKSLSNGRSGNNSAQSSGSTSEETAPQVVMVDHVQVEIDQASIKSLNPGRKLNDTIVEFYMNYVMSRVPSSKRKTFHLFNTFFYNKIKATRSGQIYDVKEVSRRWDKDVKLYDKDFLFVPICDHHHWFLVVICFPLQIKKDNRSADDTPTIKRPSLIIFDSLNVRYLSKITDPIRAFMSARREFERPGEEILDFRDRNRIKEYYARVPRQRNTYDCGIHLLNSFEHFILSTTPNLHHVIVENRSFVDSWRFDPGSFRQKVKLIIMDHKKADNDFVRTI